MSKECDPRLPCDSSGKKEKIEVTDPRSYCFNITSKPEKVCLSKSCRIVKESLDEDQDEEAEGAKKPSKLISIKQPAKTCVPWNAVSKFGVPGTRPIHEFGAAMGQQGALKPPGTLGIGGIGVGVGGGVIDGGIATTGTATGGVPLTANQQSDRETVSLARLVGFNQGPAAIMASFGDTKAAKESLASLGALSMGGAIVCDCCECDPCICGPRGLNIENILAALKTIMRSGEDLNKLVSALGPGAMKALGTIMGKESEAAAMWATGGGTTSKDKIEAAQQRGPVETASQIALREAWMRGDFDEMTSCHCLPGMCPCPGGHYVYKPKKVKPKKGIDKKRKKIRKKVKKIGEDGKEYEEWDWVLTSDSDLVSRLSDTCVCPSTKHFLTPASSETADSERLVASNKRTYWGDLMVCTCPRLQRTLAIIKPESVRFKDVILRAIKNYGLDVLAVILIRS
ncbi:uncharacterized protein LOC123681955 isoform X2 [Harmonia axyridis]|uniref:uncharacterized protein LOC123681955 isoform X2 n=1 Tax=Harmonia axyridis TaxID=115357 RepID=UPI001E276EC8|nr:uncharacterized protein LOC123681955 isoform X2 [Harmonia axyridis]